MKTPTYSTSNNLMSSLDTDTQVGSSREALEMTSHINNGVQPESNNAPLVNVELNDDNNTEIHETTNNELHAGENITEEGNTNDRLLPPELRERAARHIDSIGRHFNILDRVFLRRPNNNGEGSAFDGVFSNLTAKPDNNRATENENDTPPTYDEAAADIVPSYYGLDLSTSDMYMEEICIEGLPVGNIANLLWNIIVSTSFQFIGFLITYILHTSHAAKQGSRFGLGLTFIGYGYSMIPNNVTSKVGKYKQINRVELSDPNDFDDLHLYSKPTTQDEFESTLSHGIEEEKQKLPFLAVAISLFGLFLSVKSIIDYIKVKRMERRLSQGQV